MIPLVHTLPYHELVFILVAVTLTIMKRNISEDRKTQENGGCVQVEGLNDEKDVFLSR